MKKKSSNTSVAAKLLFSNNNNCHSSSLSVSQSSQFIKSQPSNELQSLIIDNHQLAQQKKISYQNKLNSYNEKILRLQKLLESSQQSSSRCLSKPQTVEEEHMLLQKIQRLCEKREEIQIRLDKLLQIEKEIQQCVKDGKKEKQRQKQKQRQDQRQKQRQKQKQMQELSESHYDDNFMNFTYQKSFMDTNFPLQTYTRNRRTQSQSQSKSKSQSIKVPQFIESQTKFYRPNTSHSTNPNPNKKRIYPFSIENSLTKSKDDIQPQEIKKSSKSLLKSHKNKDKDKENQKPVCVDDNDEQQLVYNKSHNKQVKTTRNKKKHLLRDLFFGTIQGQNLKDGSQVKSKPQSSSKSQYSSPLLIDDQTIDLNDDPNDNENIIKREDCLKKEKLPQKYQKYQLRRQNRTKSSCLHSKNYNLQQQKQTQQQQKQQSSQKPQRKYSHSNIRQKPFSSAIYNTSPLKLLQQPQSQPKMKAVVAQQLYQNLLKETKSIISNPALFKTPPTTVSSSSTLEQLLLVITDHLDLQKYFLARIQQKAAQLQKSNFRKEQLEYEKQGLMDQCEKYQQSVNQLLRKEKQVNQRINTLKAQEGKLTKVLEKAMQRLKTGVQAKLREIVSEDSQNKSSSQNTNLTSSILSKLNGSDNSVVGKSKQKKSPLKYQSFPLQATKVTKSEFQKYVTSLMESVNAYSKHQNQAFLKIQAHKAKLQTKLQQTKAELESYQIKRNELKKKLKIQRQQLNQLTQSISESTQQIHKLSIEYNDLQKRQQVRKASVQDYEAIIETKKLSVRELEAVCDSAYAKKKELYEKIQKMQICLEEADIQREKHHQEVKSKERDIEDMAEKLEEQSKIISKKKDQYTKIELLAEQGQRRLNAVVEQIQNRQDHISALNKNIEIKEKQLSQVDAKITDKYQCFRNVQQQLNQVSLKVSNKQSELQKLQANLQQTNISFKNMHLHYQSLSINYQQRKKSFQNLQTQSQELQRLIESETDKLKQLRLQTEQKSSNLSQLHKANSELEQESYQLLIKNEQTMKTLQESHKKVLILQQSYVKGSELYKQLQQQNNQLMKVLSEYQSRLVALTQDIQEKQQQLESYQTEQKEIVERIQILKKVDYKQCLKIGLLSESSQSDDQNVEHSNNDSENCGGWGSLPEAVQQKINKVVDELQEFQEYKKKLSKSGGISAKLQQKQQKLPNHQSKQTNKENQINY